MDLIKFDYEITCFDVLRSKIIKAETPSELAALICLANINVAKENKDYKELNISEWFNELTKWLSKPRDNISFDENTKFKIQELQDLLNKSTQLLKPSASEILFNR